MKNTKRYTALLLAGILAAASFTAYGAPAETENVSVMMQEAPTELQEAADAAVSSAETETESSIAEEMAKKLSSLDGVVSVTPVEVMEQLKPMDRFQGRYVVEFEQPIDWNNPEKGTFTQRAFVGYSDTADVTCYYAGGYNISDDLVPIYMQVVDARPDLLERYDCNYVEFEYRFFGESQPEDLSYDDIKYWEFLTSENASKDFQHMITELDQVLGGSTVFYGGSKGGYTTESLAYYDPDAVDAFISYVAPLCDGTNDPRFFNNLYHTIGDKDPSFGEGEAEHARDLMMSAQLVLLDPRVRDEGQARLMEEIAQAGLHVSPLATEDEAYEESIAEFGTGIWQNLPKTVFDDLEQIAAMPEETDEEFREKFEAVWNLYSAQRPALNVTYDSFMAPYYYQTYTEMGNAGADFSALREAGAEIRTSPEAEKDMLMRLWSPVAVNNNMPYDDTFRNELIDFMNTTEKDIIKIVGLSDPWYAVKAPVTENEHIHLYEVSGNHGTGIVNMEPEMQAECYELLDSLLGK